MKLLKVLPLVVFPLFCLAPTAAARQVACTLTAEAAPEVRGLRLGMSLEQVRARLPDVRFGEDRFGLVAATLDQSVLHSGEYAATFQGVGALNLFFVDGVLRKFNLQYLNSIHWESNEQFAARVSEALKLPAAWKGGSNGGREMECGGFQISVHTNSLSFSQPGAFDVVERRRREKQERDRRSFNP